MVPPNRRAYRPTPIPLLLPNQSSASGFGTNVTCTRAIGVGRCAHSIFQSTHSPSAGAVRGENRCRRLGGTTSTCSSPEGLETNERVLCRRHRKTPRTEVCAAQTGQTGSRLMAAARELRVRLPPPCAASRHPAARPRERRTEERATAGLLPLPGDQLHPHRT